MSESAIEKSNKLALQLLIDIERAIDTGSPDIQKIGVTIKKFRTYYGTEKIIEKHISFRLDEGGKDEQHDNPKIDGNPQYALCMYMGRPKES